jgi:hypothetical protein
VHIHLLSKLISLLAAPEANLKAGIIYGPNTKIHEIAADIKVILD